MNMDGSVSYNKNVFPFCADKELLSKTIFITSLLNDPSHTTSLNQLVFLKRNGPYPASFLYFRLFNTVDSEYSNSQNSKFLPMTGFELRTSEIGSDRSTNWAATTTALEPTSYWFQNSAVMQFTVLMPEVLTRNIFKILVPQMISRGRKQLNISSKQVSQCCFRICFGFNVKTEARLSKVQKCYYLFRALNRSWSACRCSKSKFKLFKKVLLNGFYLGQWSTCLPYSATLRVYILLLLCKICRKRTDD